MHQGLTGMLRNFADPSYVLLWVSMQKFISKYFPKSRGLRFRPRKSIYSCITVSAKNSKCTKALPECYETLQIHYMCYYGCPCKKSSGNSFPKSHCLRFRPRKSVYSCITVSAKNSKCTKALPECYETLQIHYMCYYGCPCKNASGNSFPKSRGLRFRPRKLFTRA